MLFPDPHTEIQMVEVKRMERKSMMDALSVRVDAAQSACVFA
jgi:hypothetical protein